MKTFHTFTFLSMSVAVFCGSVFAADAQLDEAPPPYPGIESWGFRKDLARPEVLVPVPTNGVAFIRGKVAGEESYRIDIAQDGQLVLDQGMIKYGNMAHNFSPFPIMHNAECKMQNVYLWFRSFCIMHYAFCIFSSLSRSAWDILR